MTLQENNCHSPNHPLDFLLCDTCGIMCHTNDIVQDLV